MFALQEVRALLWPGRQTQSIQKGCSIPSPQEVRVLLHPGDAQPKTSKTITIVLDPHSLSLLTAESSPGMPNPKNCRLAALPLFLHTGSAHRRKFVCCSTPGMPNVDPWLPVEMHSWSYCTKKRRPSSATVHNRAAIDQC